jgi:hypothetical protein
MLFALCVLLVSAEPSEPQQRLRAAVDAYTLQAIADVEAAIDESRDRKERAALGNRLKELRAGKDIAPKLFPRQLKKGAIGEWVGGYANRKDGPGHYHFEVVQVIDGSNALVESTNSHPTNEAGHAVFSPATLFWVTGDDFSNVADGGFVALKGLYEVVGTKTYDTALGTKTVWIVQKFKAQ